MAGIIPSVNTCCDPCEEPTTTAVPGPQGDAGADGADGTDGVSAYTTASSFVMPAELGNVTVTMLSSAWMGIGQVVFASGGGFVGYFQVVSKADTTHAVLKNLEDTPNGAYASNSPPTTIFPALTAIQPGGLQGPEDATPPTALLAANNLSDVASPALSRGWLGLGTAAVQAVGVFFQVANNLSDGTAATMRTNLGLGTMAIQAASAVAITGGAFNGTVGVSTPSSVVATTLSTSGNRTEAGRLIQTPSTIQSLLAASAISADAAKIRVVGNGAARTLTSTPTISAGTADGQRLLIKGTSASLTITLQDEGTLPGSTLELGAATRVLGLHSQIELSWDATLVCWEEISYSAN